MGVDSLLKTLESCFTKTNIRKLKGKRIGIDGHVWLHKSVYADNLGMAFNKNPLAYLKFLENMLLKLLEYQIIPIFVFDGAKLPFKNQTDSKREQARDSKLNHAYKLLQDNKIHQAKMQYIASIDITAEMVHHFSIVLDKYDIEYYVAPYEVNILYLN